MTNLETILKEVVKEALTEYFTENKNVVASIKKDNGIVKEEKEIKEVEVEGATGRPEELEAMSYNDLKALVKELGGKAVGSKKSIIEQILELEGAEEGRSEEHTSELQSRQYLVCRLLLEKNKQSLSCR